MVSRRSLFLGVALLALFGAGLPQAAAGDGDVIAGRVTGFCDLPPASPRLEPGWMVAFLIPEAANSPRYIFVAELGERGGPLEFRFGPVSGFLFELTPAGLQLTHFVDGMWRGFRTGAVGTWEATLYSVRTFEAVGRMGGDYTDPAPFTPGEFGELNGQWRIE